MDKEKEMDEKDHSSLLDCYRIALDFGMPAAMKAYEKLGHTSNAEQEVEFLQVEEQKA